MRRLGCALMSVLLLFVFVQVAEAVPFNNDCDFIWSPNPEADLAGYRAWSSKGGTQGPVVTIPVSPSPKVKCSALGVTSDGLWTFSVLAFDNAQTANISSVASINETRDTVAPNTTIVPTITGNSASFALSSSEAGSTFECQFDNSAFVQCTSPRTYGSIADGAHTFVARAKDAAGNVDASASSHSWTVNDQPPSQPSGLKIEAVTANP